MQSLYASLAPEELPSCLMAGYVISSVTALRLTLKLKNLDPDNLPKKPRYANLFSPRPGTFHFGDDEIIEDSIRKYMVDSGLEPSEAGVDISPSGTVENPGTIIVTKNCLIPYGFTGRRPVAEEGERERFVRRWLEHNGTLLLASLLTCPHVTHRCRQGRLQVGGLRATLRLGLGSSCPVSLYESFYCSILHRSTSTGFASFFKSAY